VFINKKSLKEIQLNEFEKQMIVYDKLNRFFIAFIEKVSNILLVKDSKNLYKN
jgi:hypothetical protein